MLFRLQAQMGSGYNSTFKQGQRSISDMRQELRGASEESGNFGGSLSGAFGAIKGAMVASGVIVGLKQIADGIGASIEASIEFESAMTGVAKTSDMSEKELAAFSEEVKELSTVIPVTTTELAGIAEVAGQLGIADDNLLEFSTIMAELGTATTMTADEAATMLAQFANITQMSTTDYERLGSTIVDLGNNYATTEQKITDMAQGIAAAGSLAGMNEAEMMGLSAAVTSLGMETQAGSTAMSKLIADMSAATEKGGQLETLAAVIGKPVEEIQKALDDDKADKALKKFAETAGMSADEFQKTWNDASSASDTLNIFAKAADMSAEEFRKAWGADATGTLAKFITGLNDTERNGKSATLVLEDLGITEVRMVRMILSLSKSGDLMNRALNTANNAWKKNTALQTEAEKRYNTTQSKLTMLDNSWNNLKITIGDKFTPILNGVIETGADFLDWLNDVIKGEGTLTDQIEKAQDAYEDETSAIDATGIVAGRYIDRLEELEDQGLDTAEAQDEYHSILEQLVSIMPDLNEFIDLETDSIRGGTEALRLNTREWIRNAAAKANQEQMEAVMDAYVAKELELSSEKAALAVAQVEYDVLVEQAGAEKIAEALNTTVRALGTYISMDEQNKLFEKGITMEEISTYLAKSLDIEAAEGEIDDRKAAVDKYTKELEDAEEAVAEVAGSMERLTEIVDQLNAKISGNWTPKAVVKPGQIGLPTYASGTRNAPYAMIAGERGPELVVGAKGAAVYSAGETRNLLGSAKGGVSIQYAPVIYATSTEDLEEQLMAHAQVIGEIVDDRLREHGAESQRRSY